MNINTTPRFFISDTFQALVHYPNQALSNHTYYFPKDGKIATDNNDFWNVSDVKRGGYREISKQAFNAKMNEWKYNTMTDTFWDKKVQAIVDYAAEHDCDMNLTKEFLMKQPCCILTFITELINKEQLTKEKVKEFVESL